MGPVEGVKRLAELETSKHCKRETVGGVTMGSIFAAGDDSA
jgi:hypothetical protein